MSILCFLEFVKFRRRARRIAVCIVLFTCAPRYHGACTFLLQLCIYGQLQTNSEAMRCWHTQVVVVVEECRVFTRKWFRNSSSRKPTGRNYESFTLIVAFQSLVSCLYSHVIKFQQFKQTRSELIFEKSKFSTVQWERTFCYRECSVCVWTWPWSILNNFSKVKCF